MIQTLLHCFGFRNKQAERLIKETVAQQQLALSDIDDRLSTVEDRLGSGERKINARLRALEYKKDVISRDRQVG